MPTPQNAANAGQSFIPRSEVNHNPARGAVLVHAVHLPESQPKDEIARAGDMVSRKDSSRAAHFVALPWPFWVAGLPALADRLQTLSREPFDVVISGFSVLLADAKVIGLFLMEAHWRAATRSAIAWDVFVAEQLPGSLLRALLAARWGAGLAEHQFFERPPVMTWRYAKLGMLIAELEAVIRQRSVAQFLDAVEAFARRSSNQWLKVAGGEKGEVLEMTALAPACSMVACRGASALEFGAFIGYTAARLAACTGWPIVSFEHDPVHVRVAQHFLDLSGPPCLVEVWSGRVADLTPRSAESRGAHNVGIAFLDESGAAFASDHARLARCALLTPRGRSA